MTKRQAVQIPEHLLKKIQEVIQIRRDLKGYDTSKIVFELLQEAIKENLNNKSNSKGPLQDGPVM